LLRANSILTGTPTSSVIDSQFEAQLEQLKAELHSVRYERMVVDVFTRQIVEQTQRSAMDSGLGPPTHQSTTRRNSILALDPKRRVYQPTASFASKITPSSSSSGSGGSGGNTAATALASKKRSIQRLQEYIDLPTYQPGAGSSIPTNSPHTDATRASTLFPLRVRSVGRDSLVVPSLRQGSSLPVELSSLRLKTTIAPPYYYSSSAAAGDSLRRSADDASTLPMARNLYRQIKRNEAQIHDVREALQQHTVKYVTILFD